MYLKLALTALLACHVIRPSLASPRWDIIANDEDSLDFAPAGVGDGYYEAGGYFLAGDDEVYGEADHSILAPRGAGLHPSKHLKSGPKTKGDKQAKSGQNSQQKHQGVKHSKMQHTHALPGLSDAQKVGIPDLGHIAQHTGPHQSHKTSQHSHQKVKSDRPQHQHPKPALSGAQKVEIPDLGTAPQHSGPHQLNHMSRLHHHHHRTYTQTPPYPAWSSAESSVRHRMHESARRLRASSISLTDRVRSSSASEYPYEQPTGAHGARPIRGGRERGGRSLKGSLPARPPPVARPSPSVRHPPSATQLGPQPHVSTPPHNLGTPTSAPKATHSPTKTEKPGHLSTSIPPGNPLNPTAAPGAIVGGPPIPVSQTGRRPTDPYKRKFNWRNPSQPGKYCDSMDFKCGGEERRHGEAEHRPGRGPNVEPPSAGPSDPEKMRKLRAYRLKLEKLQPNHRVQMPFDKHGVRPAVGRGRGGRTEGRTGPPGGKAAARPGIRIQSPMREFPIHPLAKKPHPKLKELPKLQIPQHARGKQAVPKEVPGPSDRAPQGPSGKSNKDLPKLKGPADNEKPVGKPAGSAKPAPSSAAKHAPSSAAKPAPSKPATPEPFKATSVPKGDVATARNFSKYPANGYKPGSPQYEESLSSIMALVKDPLPTSPKMWMKSPKVKTGEDGEPDFEGVVRPIPIAGDVPLEEE